MRKEELAQYKELIKEIRDLEIRINRLRKKQKEEIVFDTVSGSSPDFPHEKRVFSIRGFGNRTRLEREEAYLRLQKKECEDLREKITIFIGRIPDSRTRRVFRMYYLDGMSFEQIARREYMSESNIRNRIHNDYFKKRSSD